jgi:two-component system, chemotaxis family, chemotaxis protein CheY
MSKVIIVDDSKTLRNQITKTLCDAGYITLCAKDGVEGLKVINENKDIKLILADVNMPNMDGITMCSKIKDDDSLKHIPIFMLTTETGNFLKNQGKQIGVLAWIIKPYNPARLIQIIGKVIKN